MAYPRLSPLEFQLRVLQRLHSKVLTVARKYKKPNLQGFKVFRAPQDAPQTLPFHLSLVRERGLFKHPYNQVPRCPRFSARFPDGLLPRRR